MELAIFTAARSGEVRGALWSEIDLDANLWVIPASRMKATKEHRVPLSSAALDLLKGLDRSEGHDLVFFGERGRKVNARGLTPISDMTLTTVIRRMNEGSAEWLDPKTQCSSGSAWAGPVLEIVLRRNPNFPTKWWRWRWRIPLAAKWSWPIGAETC